MSQKGEGEQDVQDLNNEGTGTVDMSVDEAVPLTCFEKADEFFTDPSSSAASLYFSLFMMSVIVISVSAMCIETLAVYHKKDVQTWFIIELICILAFTAEYIACLVVTPRNKLEYVFCDVMNVIDLLAILPFWVELIVTAMNPGAGGGSMKVFQVLRVLRLVRVMRVMKMSKYSVGAQVFARAIGSSLQPLSMMVFFIFIAMVLFSSAIYYMEKGIWDPDLRLYIRDCGVYSYGETQNAGCPGDGDPSPYQSIPASFWWCIVTMTTLGYGDQFPVTTNGKLFAALTAVAGVVVLALPISVIGASFQTEFNRVVRQQEMLAFMSKASSGEGLSAKDRDNDGKVSPGESLLFEIEHTLRIHQRDLSSNISELLDSNKTDVFVQLAECINSKRRKGKKA